MPYCPGFDWTGRVTATKLIVNIITRSTTRSCFTSSTSAMDNSQECAPQLDLLEYRRGTHNRTELASEGAGKGLLKITPSSTASVDFTSNRVTIT